MLDPTRRSEWDEYSMLMRDCFRLLSLEKQHKMLKWIDEGPNVTRFKQRFETAYHRAPTDEQIEEVVRIWKKHRIDLIVKDLSGKLKSEFASLVALSTAADETSPVPRALEGAGSIPLRLTSISLKRFELTRSLIPLRLPSPPVTGCHPPKKVSAQT